MQNGGMTVTSGTQIFGPQISGHDGWNGWRLLGLEWNSGKTGDLKLLKAVKTRNRHGN